MSYTNKYNHIRSGSFSSIYVKLAVRLVEGNLFFRILTQIIGNFHNIINLISTILISIMSQTNVTPQSSNQATNKANLVRIADTIWSRMPRVNAELFSLTYGSLVQQIIRDYEEVPMINQQLEKLGHNIGIRLIDEFLAKSNSFGLPSCSNFKDTAEVIAKIAFKMFLGISVEVPPNSWSADGSSCSLVFYDNPLIEFVELPQEYIDLQYCNIIIGVLKGALEMVQLQVDCKFIRDTLKGDEFMEIKLENKGIIRNVMSDDYKEN